MRQRRWVELINDYYCDIRYHPGKANIVTDVLSHKEKVKPLRVRSLNMTIQTNLVSRIQNAQLDAMKEENVKNEGISEKDKNFKFKSDGTRYFANRIWIPKIGGLRELVMDEAHMTRYSIHPGHGVPISIIFDRDSRFTLRFWQSLQKALGVIDFGSGWDQYLPLDEFSYNNSYHSSIKAAPFEALYGRKCVTHN
ncbi:uncharacterized protein [Rutidosis leptorrhynchoides]|uniref:uncharacterized protein n=1 Tax=Rutidosis leptorrhynchoides TaxID=125765 RepID=UPI003A99C379